MRQGCEIIVTKEVSALKDPNPRIIKLRNLIFLDSANVSASKILVADTIVQTFQTPALLPLQLSVWHPVWCLNEGREQKADSLSTLGNKVEEFQAWQYNKRR